jgi:RNA polymerase sigma factor (TIGR02999 family)
LPGRLRPESRECTFEPTALVHESYLRLADQTRLEVESRVHFYAIAANVMRSVLIDHARKRNSQKRAAGLRITSKTDLDFAEQRAPDSLLLDEALRKLAEVDERKSRAIELKFFGGMTTEEIAQFSETKIDRWKLIQDIVQGALEVPRNEQSAYLARLWRRPGTAFRSSIPAGERQR